MKTIKINGKDFFYRLNIGAFSDFEDLTGKSIEEIKKLKDMCQLFYCAITRGKNKDFDMDYETFIDFIDEDENILNTITETFNEVNPNANQKSGKKK
ncbi:hypothetical protein [Marinifilum flexuosum]|uniref:hypothetical protein n=1 Tax=Marinifilum flexuosum TaxID=1117708 RepID=UPI0024947CCE|nr:hypothetical protein [Marinifilum flexuosum]